MVMRSMLLCLLVAGLTAGQAPAPAPTEKDYWTIREVPLPKGLVLEVGGLLPHGDRGLLVATRRGEIWHVDDIHAETPEFTLWTDGMHEPLGLLRHEGWIYTAQRGELTRMRDTDGDGRGDEFQVVCDEWPISGNYHEYTFGPVLDREGNLWVTLNKPFGDEPFGKVGWRGWAMRITPDGEMQPVCAGLRSPAGVATSPGGDVFYTDNQGEWCGASKLSHLEEGDFHGHPHGIESCREPISRVPHPGPVPDGLLMPVAAKQLKGFKFPAIWFPYDKMGKSPSGFVWDTDGALGPFKGQLFVADQHHAAVFRCDLERIDGHWQGACFPFRSGFACGIIRVKWHGKHLVVGMSNRGWGGKGNRPYGLQTMVWTGKTPFEVLRMRARPDGFALELTEPVDPATVDPRSFRFESYTYLLHEKYGSKEADKKLLEVSGARVLDGGRRVVLEVEGLREGYVHEMHAPGLRSAKGVRLLHDKAYYTLINRPR